jgi:predicted O-linked N-acetylglucosamine transferase (SPINDLY family)
MSEERLDIRGPEDNHESHLALYREMDIALDTFPYHGTTTTCEALWMGVPVVTLAGQTHVSRVGVSLLNNAGLPELVAGSEDEYVRIAAELARNIERLAGYRANLRDQMRASRLLDAPSFARDLEGAFRQMWTSWVTSPDSSNTSNP